MIQLQVLNKILQDKDPTIIILNDLNVDYFSDYKQEFLFIKNHLDKYDLIPDLTTFLNSFPNFEVFEVNEPLQYLLEELVKDRNKRFLADNFNKVRTCIMNNDVDAAMQILMDASNQAVRVGSLQAVDLVNDTSRYGTYLDVMDNHNKYFITTGFKELDDILSGWSVNDDLVTLCARNGVGKTWIMLKCAVAAAMEGRTVGIYSGEMSEDSIGYRVDTLISNLPNGSLVHGGASVKNSYRKFLDDINKIVPGRIFVVTPKQLNGSASVSILKAFIHKYDLEILFVDQHSLMRDDRRARDRVEKANNISEDLKGLQSTERIPIIACAQQNRTTTEGGFDTTQIANSDRIGQDSSVVLFIEKKDDILKLHGVKVRQGISNFTLTYRINLNEGQFRYVPENADDGSRMVDSNNIGYSEDDVF